MSAGSKLSQEDINLRGRLMNLEVDLADLVDPDQTARELARKE